MSSSASTSPPGRSDLGKKFEAAARQRNTAKEEALRASKEEEFSREQHVIKTGVSQRFPQGEDTPVSGVEHAGTTLPNPRNFQCQGCESCRERIKTPGSLTFARPASSPVTGSSCPSQLPLRHLHHADDSKSPLVSPQDAPREAGDKSAKIVVEATTPPSGHDDVPIDSLNNEAGRPTENNPAIAEFRSQLAEQKAICEGLQRDVAQKDKEINALEAEVRSVKHTLVDAEPNKIAGWRAKFENVKRLLQDTEEEVEQLKMQLKEAKDRERALQKRLDEAKDEADLRERALRNRVDEVEDEARRLRERAEGNTVAPQTSINYYSISQQQLFQQPHEMNGRRDSGVCTTTPLLVSPSSSRSTEADRASSQPCFTARTDSNGKKRLQTERRRKYTATGLGKMTLA